MPSICIHSIYGENMTDNETDDTKKDKQSVSNKIKGFIMERIKKIIHTFIFAIIFTIIMLLVMPIIAPHLIDTFYVPGEIDRIELKLDSSIVTGDSLMKDGDCEGAIEVYRKALQLYNNTSNKDIQIQFGSKIIFTQSFKVSEDKLYKELHPYLATLYNNMGLALYQCQVTNNKEQNLNDAINAYDEALKIRTCEDYPLQYAETMNNLGKALYSLSEIQDKTKNLKKAIVAYNNTLEIRTPENHSLEYADTMNNLGDAYYSLSKDWKKMSYLKAAIDAYNNSLYIYEMENKTYYCSMVKNDLGVAYLHLSEVENTKCNLDDAILLLSEANNSINRKDYPLEYAEIMNNLGDAYRYQSEIVENNLKKYYLDNSIYAYNKALEIRTYEDYRADYATTIDRRAIVLTYYSKINGNKRYILDAIDDYDIIISNIRTQEEYPLDYAESMNNLGVAYYYLSELEILDEKKEEDLYMAIKCYENALENRTRNDYPIIYAETEQNLGLAYRDLAKIQYEDRTENLKNATKSYKMAIETYNQEECPRSSAGASHNLGKVYYSLAKIEGAEYYKCEAINAFENALKFYTQEEYPDMNRIINSDLAEAEKLPT